MTWPTLIRRHEWVDVNSIKLCSLGKIYVFKKMLKDKIV